MLRELSEAYGVSGHEEPVREIIAAAITEHVDEQRVDALGNLIALKKGRGRGKKALKVMVAAHMDEVGLMIVNIEKDGTLRFLPVGGVDPRVLLAKTVLIGDGKVPGVIGFKPIHKLRLPERTQVPKPEELNIDIGVSSKEEAERLVKVGDYVMFHTQFAEVPGSNQRTVIGKAFDDRAGCAVLIDLLKEKYPFDLYAVFTVQEEVGLRGARVAAYAIEPDVAFVLEGTVCDDMPKKRDVSPTTRLGGGPALTIMDRSVITDRRLVNLLISTAEELGIPYQFKQPAVGGTDAGAIHLTKEGVPSAVAAVPARYIHSPVCMASLDDFDHTVQLMKAALVKLPGVELRRE